MRKTVAVIGLVAATLVLTGCGEDKPKSPGFACGHPCTPLDAKDKAEIAKEHKEELFWRDVSQTVDDLHSADEFGNDRNLQDETIEKVTHAGWIACKVLESGKGEDAAQSAIANSLDRDLSWTPGEDVIYDIMSAAEWGMCPKYS